MNFYLWKPFQSSFILPIIRVRNPETFDEIGQYFSLNHCMIYPSFRFLRCLHHYRFQLNYQWLFCFFNPLPTDHPQAILWRPSTPWWPPTPYWLLLIFAFFMCFRIKIPFLLIFFIQFLFISTTLGSYMKIWLHFSFDFLLNLLPKSYFL